MKKILFTIGILIAGLVGYSQPYITGLNLKGSTVKVLTNYIYGNQDTTIGNAYFKVREDYIDGSVPADAANVSISIVSVQVIARLYEIILNLPGWVNDQHDVLGDFRTSITAARNTNATLDELCDALEAKYTAQYSELLTNGLKLLSSK